jgi:hypothetical protein
VKNLWDIPYTILPSNKALLYLRVQQLYYTNKWGWNVLPNKREHIYEAFGDSFSVLDISEPINIYISPDDTMLTAWEALMESDNKD